VRGTGSWSVAGNGGEGEEKPSQKPPLEGGTGKTLAHEQEGGQIAGRRLERKKGGEKIPRFVLRPAGFPGKKGRSFR